ncbi:MAG: hypothetical protein KIT09_17585 [Bryobacteraceae bacterium]|nr:hypothetical protein [Bryobacteraceae bacterium]
MEKSQFERLRGYQAAFRSFLKEYENRGETVGDAVERLAREAARAREEFPETVPPFDKDEFRGRWVPEMGRYETARIRNWLLVALARLEEAEAVRPETLDACDYPMVEDRNIRKILERDFEEIRRAFAAQCWKSVIVLAGGSIEGLLAERLLRDGSVSGAPRRLQDLIALARKRNIVSPAVERLTQSAREYRNLVHPRHEIESGLTVDAEEARIAVEILRIVRRDLAKAGAAEDQA